MQDEMQTAAYKRGYSNENFKRIRDLLMEILEDDGKSGMFMFAGGGVMMLLIEHAMLMSIAISEENLVKAEKNLKVCFKEAVANAKAMHTEAHLKWVHLQSAEGSDRLQ